LSLFPARALLRYELLPLRKTPSGTEVASSRLYATEELDALRLLTGLRLIPVLAPRQRILKALRQRLGVGADTIDSLDEERQLEVVDEDTGGDVNLDEAAGDASIIRFVNQVIREAIGLRATDVHLEPFEDEMRIRYRVDGVLQEVPVPAQLKRYQPAIVSRVKILSRLDIAEKRLPQDGRIKVRLDGHDVDVRVSLIPMLHGEGVVMRLLQQDAGLMRLAELSMDTREHGIFRDLLAMPHGIVLVTGPTGSGKTTTLYSALNEINDAGRKIITIEDPVEYHIKGINQIQVSEKAGLTFARGLRSILRHDPDVLLIGEIRDAETAQIATQASLTGHLVFSTLHTNDAPGALARLVDMGVEPFLVAAALEGVLAQRLVRVLCDQCKEEDDSASARALKRDTERLKDRVVYRARGCEACRFTGFRGRRAVFEMMRMTEEIREILLTTRSPGAIRAAAVRDGLRSLSEDGWRLVAEGVTTAEEVLRVTKDSRANGLAKPPVNGPERAVPARGEAAHGAV
jgi:general secretion pathway protein E/type IV pilus assembly protein PilB